MLLDDFLQRFGALGDELLAQFPRPFLVEEGRLSVEDDDDPGAAARRRIFYLGPDADELVVGRSDGADISIGDANVSGRHAKLVAPRGAEGRWTVVDLASRNGTFLNGKQLGPHAPAPLGDEATIAFGPGVDFVFVEPPTLLLLARRLAAPAAGAPPAAAAPVSLAAETQVAMARPPLADLLPDDVDDDLVTGDGAPAPEGPLFLHCDPFDAVPLEPGKPVIVGRSAVHASLVLPHPQCSRAHAEFQRRPGGVFVRDLRSANGTFVGGTKIGGDPVRLTLGQEVSIADFKLSVRATSRSALASTMVTAPSPRARKDLIRGHLERLPLEKLLLELEEKQKSGVLEVHDGKRRGRIAFRAGAPVSASLDGGPAGAAAIAEMLDWKAGPFTIDPTPPAGGDREVPQAFRDIVLEKFLS